MSIATPKTIYRSDYTPPAYRIPSLDLRFELGDDLRGEGDFGNQYDSGAAAGDTGTGELDVELCLARAGDAVYEASACWSRHDGVVGCLLVVIEHNMCTVSQGVGELLVARATLLGEAARQQGLPDRDRMAGIVGAEPLRQGEQARWDWLVFEAAGDRFCGKFWLRRRTYDDTRCAA